MKTAELANIQGTISEIANKSAGFESQLEKTLAVIEETLNHQFNEYITSVDHGGSGINSRLKKKFKNVEDAIDSLIKYVEKESKEAEDFKNNFLDSLAKKDMFYQQLGSGVYQGDMENSSLDDDPKKNKN